MQILARRRAPARCGGRAARGKAARQWERNMGRPPSSKPTSFDIAYLAGVSQPTVSRALRGSKSVSAATRANIERIAREPHSTVDKNASSLPPQRTHTNALISFAPQPDPQRADNGKTRARQVSQ